MDGGAWWAAVHGVAELDTTEWLHFHFSLSRIVEGNGNPLQCSCLENPRDGGAWWAAVYGVAQSQTWVKRLSSSSSSSNLMWRVDSLEKTLMLGGIGGRRRRGRQRMRRLDGITDLIDMSVSKPRELMIDREAWRTAIHGVARSQTWLSDWTELNCKRDWKVECLAKENGQGIYGTDLSQLQLGQTKKNLLKAQRIIEWEMKELGSLMISLSH